MSAIDEIVIKPGRARINVLDVHIDAENFLAIEIDMRSKYVEPVVANNYHGHDQLPSEVILLATDRTLRVDESYEEHEQTTITLPPRCAGWEIVTAPGRYTIQIAAWKRPEQ